MPPVGPKVRAFKTRSDVPTASRQGPWYVQRADHSRHQASVSRAAVNGSSLSGKGR